MSDMSNFIDGNNNNNSSKKSGESKVIYLDSNSSCTEELSIY